MISALALDAMPITNNAAAAVKTTRRIELLLLAGKNA